MPIRQKPAEKPQVETIHSEIPKAQRKDEGRADGRVVLGVNQNNQTMGVLLNEIKNRNPLSNDAVEFELDSSQFAQFSEQLARDYSIQGITFNVRADGLNTIQFNLHGIDYKFFCKVPTEAPKELLYNEDGTIKDLVGNLNYLTKSNLKGQRVLRLGYDLQREHEDPYNAAKLLIEAIESDLVRLKLMAEDLKTDHQ